MADNSITHAREKKQRSEDWVGFRHGGLVITAFIGVQKYNSGRACIFKFRCDCGREFDAQKSNVIPKRKSCGCDRQKIGRATAPNGYTNHPLAKIWNGMHSRCFNKNTKSYKDYGLRGVTVCDRWRFGEDGKTGFECFVSDMGHRAPGMTIERIKYEKGYEPSNCMWLPKGDQSKNRRTVRIVRIGASAHTIPEWCEINGISYWTAMQRIYRGWSPHKAVTTPAR